MMKTWKCEQTAFTKVSRWIAWTFWSDLSNHADMEPGVDRIDLEGPFATGTIGRTVAADCEQQWELTDVVEGRQFGIRGYTPDGRGALSFSWVFEDDGNSTRIIYRIQAHGPDVEAHSDVFRAMEAAAPKALARLAAELDRLAQRIQPPT